LIEILLSAAPDVTIKTINEDWEFILIACDGIWDVLSNEEALKFVRDRVAQQMPPETVSNLKKMTFFYLIFCV
jgi:protein phosphatase 2C family protein 2/3